MTSPPTDRTAPLHLWRIARAFLDTLFNLFGAPEEIAARHTLTTKRYALLRTWLRAGEAMMRHLLLIEAAAYPRPNTRPLLHPRRARTRRLVGCSADKPEDWRVSFCCLSSSPARGGSPERSEGKGDVGRAPSERCAISSPASGGDKQRFFSAWPLAERLEALLRVFNDPAPYAARLARRLHATPHRVREVLKHAANVATLIGAESFAKIISASAESERAFNSS